MCIVYNIITCIFTSDSVIHENFDKIFPKPSSYLCIAEKSGGIIDIRQCGKDCHISSMQSLATHAGQKISMIKSLPMRAGGEIGTYIQAAGNTYDDVIQLTLH